MRFHCAPLICVFSCKFLRCYRLADLFLIVICFDQIQVIPRRGDFPQTARVRGVERALSIFEPQFISTVRHVVPKSYRLHRNRSVIVNVSWFNDVNIFRRYKPRQLWHKPTSRAESERRPFMRQRGQRSAVEVVSVDVCQQHQP